jgi:hypothetical protein
MKNRKILFFLATFTIFSLSIIAGANNVKVLNVGDPDLDVTDHLTVKIHWQPYSGDDSYGTKELTIYNRGEGSVLTWSATSSVDEGSISITPSSGTIEDIQGDNQDGYQDVTVRVNHKWIRGGSNFDGEISISSNGGSETIDVLVIYDYSKIRSFQFYNIFHSLFPKLSAFLR